MIEDSHFKLGSLVIHILVMLILGLLCVSDRGQQLLIHIELSLVHALVKVLILCLLPDKVLVFTELLGSVSNSLLFSL